MNVEIASVRAGPYLLALSSTGDIGFQVKGFRKQSQNEELVDSKLVSAVVYRQHYFQRWCFSVFYVTKWHKETDNRRISAA